MASFTVCISNKENVTWIPVSVLLMIGMSENVTFFSTWCIEYGLCIILSFLNMVQDLFIYIFSTYALLSFLFRLIVWSGLDIPTFATRRLHVFHHARAPSCGRWDCGREMSGKFCLIANFHITFRDILHAVKLGYGTNSLTSPPKVGVLRIFLP
jgi:hypothetical protein